MKFQEGMRRMGLTFGTLGALTISYFAYWPVADVAAQRKVHAEFQSLMNLHLARNIAKQVSEEKMLVANIEIPPSPTPTFDEFAKQGHKEDRSIQQIGVEN